MGITRRHFLSLTLGSAAGVVSVSATEPAVYALNKAYEDATNGVASDSTLDQNNDVQAKSTLPEKEIGEISLTAKAASAGIGLGTAIYHNNANADSTQILANDTLNIG